MTILVDPGATANFVGTGLSFAYQSSNTNSPNSTFSDFLTVSGTFGTIPNNFLLHINSASGTANTAPRQFTFNGASPVVVPEAGSLALLLPALGIVGAAVAQRKGRFNRAWRHPRKANAPGNHKGCRGRSR